MSASDVDVEVLIVGGGPVGLTARALLERWGVSTALVEKRAGLSPFPRSRLINVRSMEIFRHLGVADAITAQAFAPRYGRIRFRDTLFDEDWATEGMVGVNTPIPESPAVGAVTSQDRLEPILLRAADAPVHFAVELVDLIEEPERVVATLRDQRDGSQTRFRARYVIAADGASSSVRHLLGLTTSGPGALGTFSTVVYDLDLSGWSADQPAGVYFTAHGLVGPVYPEGGWMWFAPSPPDVDDADWPSLVGRAINGDGETAVSVVQVQHWTMQAFVAPTTCAGSWPGAAGVGRPGVAGQLPRRTTPGRPADTAADGDEQPARDPGAGPPPGAVA